MSPGRSLVIPVALLAGCAGAPAPATPVATPAASPAVEAQTAEAPQAAKAPVVAAAGDTFRFRIVVQPAHAVVLVEGRPLAPSGVVTLKRHPSRLFNIEATAPGYRCSHSQVTRTGQLGTIELHLTKVQPGDPPCHLGRYKDGLDEAQPLPEIPFELPEPRR